MDIKYARTLVMLIMSLVMIIFLFAILIIVDLVFEPLSGSIFFKAISYSMKFISLLSFLSVFEGVLVSKIAEYEKKDRFPFLRFEIDQYGEEKDDAFKLIEKQRKKCAGCNSCSNRYVLVNMMVVTACSIFIALSESFLWTRVDVLAISSVASYVPVVVFSYLVSKKYAKKWQLHMFFRESIKSVGKGEEGT